ncbi:MAG TPA: LCP family protein [Halanaerobiales bacterium]|nr:LCP family protein [Halanaerobiales bacterium]
MDESKEKIKNNSSKKGNYKLYIAIGIALIILAIGFYLYYCYPELIPGMASTELKEDVSLLVIGLDDEESVEKGETNIDALVLFELKPEENQLKIINVISDKRSFDSEVDEEEIGSLIADIGEISSTEIKKHLTISYQGFVDLIDNLGGIDITLEEELRIPDLELELEEGANVLTGYEALNYCRWYDYTKNERDRIERQQQVLEAIIQKVYSSANLLDIPQLFETTVDTYKTVNTNIDYSLVADIISYFNDNEDLEYNYSISMFMETPADEE